MIPFLLTLAVCAPQEEADYYPIDYLTPPDGEVLEVAGMDFWDDDTLLVSTRRGRVWWIENALAENPEDARFHIFCEGLFEGLGLRVIDGEIFVVQRSELSKLIDLDGDKVCDRIETISQGWGMSGNYHEFAFGLPTDAEGHFYVSTNVGFMNPEWWLGASTEPYRGWILQIDKEGQTTPWASGVRSPAGLGQDSAGRIFYTDNQGDWMPVCGLFHVQKDAFYGHPASLRWREDWDREGPLPDMTNPPTVPRTPPALWIPYAWSRSTGAVIENQTDGKFGPFDGDLFLAELTNGMVLRAMLEEVEGHVQGACVPFRSKVGSAFRIRFASDGTLFSGFTNRGWGGKSPGSGIARMRWSGQAPREYSGIRLAQDGFELDFTQPHAALPGPEDITVRSYDYNWWWDYGSPEMRSAEHVVSGIEAIEGGVKLTVEGLEAGRNVRVKIANAGLLHDEFDYTIHRMPGSVETVFVAKEVEPPVVNQHPEEGWLTLTWVDPFDAFVNGGEGWELVNADLDPKDPTQFVTTPGNGALVNTGFPAPGFQTKMEFGDIEFRFAFMLPEGGDSGMYFMGRYELQLNDDPKRCLGVIGGKNPRAEGYRGPGEWHVVTGKFYAPRFDSSGNKTANARFAEVQADGVMVFGSSECENVTPGGVGVDVGMDEVPFGPLFFQGNAGRVAMGDIRVRHLVEGGPEHEGEGWQNVIPAENESRVTGTGAAMPFEIRGNLDITEKGSAALWLGPDVHLVIDHVSFSKSRTGTVGGMAETETDPSFGLIKTQLLQPGIPFDLLVRGTPGPERNEIEVWLNGIRVQRLQTASTIHQQSIRLEPERTPGTVTTVHSLKSRLLPL